MIKKLPFIGENPGNLVILVWSTLILIFFVTMIVIIFPVMIFNSAPEAHVAEGGNGYVALSDNPDVPGGQIFKLRGQWEFYPGELYTFQDFTSGKINSTRLARFPHYWKHESDDVIGGAGYATYRMRVRVPASFDGIGIYSRFQYSAYEIYLNDILICGAGTVNKDFEKYKPVFLPSNGYTSASIGAEGRTFSVILHVQNGISDLGAFGNDILIGPADSVKTLRTVLVLINGFISGGLLLLFICFLLIYLNGRKRKEYLDYTIVSLVTLFISLTNGGESLMYSIGLDSVLLMRLEYCTFITGAFFANYRTIKNTIKSKYIFAIIYAYTFTATALFIFAPMSLTTNLRSPVIGISIVFFTWPLISSFKNLFVKHDFSAIASFISYLIIFFGIGCFATGTLPWDSVDVFSFSIMLHCVLQMLIFLHRYRKTEERLENMTETLEERIAERTIELTLMKEKAEDATLAKSNFLATMSHEIRTPMNAIMGISDLMRTDNLDNIQQNYLLDIKKSSKALLQIINDILDFSKIEAGKLEIIPVHFNLMAVYDNICSICQFSADAKHLDFRRTFAPDVPHYVFGDEIRYRQVILNIVNNAIKYTKEGYVDFKVEMVELYGEPFLRFTVHDTGVGIKPEDVPKVFDSFEQLDSQSNRKIVGTGLGLSISKQLVTLMNGDIQLQSEYGEGTTFTVYLPYEAGDSDKISMQEDYVPVKVSGARVLVVDDNQINLTVAEGFLAVHGISPDTAMSGMEAIEKVRRGQYDLVFMDHMMPEMDGVDATRIIRTIDDDRYKDLPIVALSANAVTGAKELFLEAGMNDFLSKPIESAHINRVLAKWLPEDKISFDAFEPEFVSDIEDDCSHIFDELYKIEGLNVDDGISHVANNKSVYLSILRQFCKELDNYIEEIMLSMRSGNWSDYTIKVHAMKGVFANLGASKLSKWAYHLESSSRNGDYPTCQSETEAFCESMGLFREKLLSAKLMTCSEEPIEKTPIEAPELKQMLEKLSGACMMGDSDSAEEVQKELVCRSFNGEIDAELDEIYNLVNSFDFDIVADKIKELLPRIR